MNESEFKKHYERLNPQQKEAVDAVEGPVMVVAGPGTGKTQILTLRIANILKQTDTQPENILALTFTESGVASMRRRLAGMIGSPAYSVVISTFHGFCNDIIKNYPGEFPRIIGSQNITEVDQINILEEAIINLFLKELKPFGDTFYYLKPILSAINDLKREGVDLAQFEKIVGEELKAFNEIEDLYHEKGAHKGKMKGDYQKLLKQLNKNQELVSIYNYYQEQLEKAKLYDYSDMIIEVLRELETNKNLLLILQEQHQYLLVDEHQDTNNAQNKIMELLCNFHPNPNIFVVGDEKQAIFRFQGASLENFMYFKKLYPSAKLIVLEDNYRSTQPILDSAHSLLAGKRALKANTTNKEEKIKLYHFSKPEVECYFLAKDIEEKIQAGAKPEQVAVLYRDNRDVIAISKMFEKIGLPFAIESDQDVLSDNEVKKLIIILRTVSEFGSQEKLIEAMHVDFFGIQPIDIYRIMECANSRKISVFSVVSSKEMLESLKLENSDNVLALFKNLSSWAIAHHNEDFPEFMERIIGESGILAYILNRKDMLEKMDKLNGLFDEVQSLVEKHKNYSLADFLKYLDILESHNILVKKKSTAEAVGQVRLMTAHRSKGQEFDYVYIVNAFDGHWGNKRRPNPLPLPRRVYFITTDRNGASSNAVDKSGIDDERRLFYVALTRAKKEVAITYARESISGQEQLPCQFVQEINPELLEINDTEAYEKGFNSKRDILFAPSIVRGVDVKSKEFIKELFIQRGLAVTGLNNYLLCPWKYFYTNLLRIPMAKAGHQLYGTAIHESFKDFFNAFNHGEQNPDKNFLLDRFNFYISQESFSDRELPDWKKRGIDALSGYYDTYYKDWKRKVICELNIGGLLLTPEIRLTGKIDKIEFPGIGNEVNVVDYKTGKPKSRGEIEGSTRSSNGDIKRQLVFYNLLLNKSETLPAQIGSKYKMVSGDIDFVEPDERGRYKKESFVINPEEIVELEDLIKNTAEEIMNLSFWDKTCDEKDCHYCSLRQMIKA